jgi:hypothetical protein
MKILHTLLAVVLAAASISANAGPLVGPVEDNSSPTYNGFPSYYEDGGLPESLALELCMPSDSELTAGTCLLNKAQPPLPADIPDENSPISFPDNFPDEAFYFNAGALTTLLVPPPPLESDKVTLVLALEAAFANSVVDGDQMVFSRVRYKFVAPIKGTYTIQTPYTTDEKIYDEGELVFETLDIGVACAQGDFSCALNGKTFPFLRATNTLNGAALPPIQLHGKMYLADPAVDTYVTGGPNGNIFRITVIPDGSPEGTIPTLVAETDQFSLMGRVFEGPLPSITNIDRATYARNALDPQGVVDVFATSRNGFGSIQATNLALDIKFDNPSDPMISSVMDAPDATAPTKFQAHTPNTNSSVPSSVTVTNNSGVPTEANADVTDLVLITEARYENGKLNVTAGSSDEVTPPVLTVKNSVSSQVYGDITGSGTLSVSTSAPANVTVTSAAGGQASMAVTVIPAVPPVGASIPPAANAPLAKKAAVKKPKVSISSIGLASESGVSGQFMVSLSAPCTKNLKVKFNIQGKAKNGKDYNKIASSLLIPVGSESGIINVIAKDDKKREGRELATLKLSKDKGYSVGGATASVMIEDND